MNKFSKTLMKFTMSFIAIVVLTLGIGLHANAAASYFNAYDKAPYEVTSDDFSLTVDGKSVDVVTYFEGRGGEFAYAHLAYEGTASFQIKSLGGNISSYNLSPHSYGMNASLSGSTLSFNLTQDGSRYIILQATVNGSNKMLVIAADPKEDYDEYLNVDRVVDVTKAPYNADNTGNEYASDIIQQAINDVSAAGGGTVYVPKGVYKIVYIDGADNVTLFLDEGAFLRGSGITEDYTWNETGANGRQGRRDIDLKTSKNFKLVGRGVVDGNSIALVDATSNGNNSADGWDDFRKGIIDGNGATGFVMDGVTVKDSAGWTFCVMNSKDITIKNVKLLADYKFIHTDGYDFVNCQDVYITECLGICGDDVYCPKAQVLEEEGGIPMLNYLIENSVAFAHGGAGCKIGMQARITTDNIVFRNIDVVQGYRGFTVAHDTGSGNFTNIVFEDIRTEKLNTHTGTSGQFQAAPFVIWTRNSSNSGAVVDGVEVTRCSFENDADIKGLIQGSEGAKSWVRNITITDLMIEGTLVSEDNWADYVRHGSYAENIKYVVTNNAEAYEAENAARTSGTTVNNKGWASNGQTVGNVGLMDTGVESVTFTVPSDEACYADLTIYYATKGTRYTHVSVNGAEPIVVECPGTDWNTLRSVTAEVVLNAGTNKITLSNDEAAAPNLDKIEIVHTETIIADSNDINAPIKVYEAENAVRTSGTTVNNKNWASNGQTVGNVGLMDTGAESVTFTVASAEASTVDLTIYYATKGTRYTHVSVNGAEPIVVECPGTDWNKLRSVSTVVELKEGNNVITLSNDEAAAPNLDRMEIAYTYGSYEAEEGVLTGTAKVVDKGWASGGHTVGDLGLGASGLGTIEITVPSGAAQSVELTIYYATKGTRYTYVNVNGGNTVEVECPGTDWNTLRSVTTVIELEAGTNVIELTNENAPTPNLDRIVIAPN